MSLNQREAKIYGAVETDSHITFTGFCKKIYSTEQQTINIFIDGKKIDTIEANQHIEEIEDKYDVFDTNGFCFTYKVPHQYIGEKHNLEFITNDNNQLLNSPTVTMDKNNINYFEYSFLNGLHDALDTDKLQESIDKNAIGFLMEDENLKDEEFIEYIKELYARFPDTTFKVFYFNNLQKEKALDIFKREAKNFEFIQPSNIYDISKNVGCYINNLMNKKFILLRDTLMFNKNGLYTLSFVKANSYAQINDNDIKLYNVIKQYIEYDINACKSRAEFRNFDLIELCLENPSLRVSINEFHLNL